MRRRRPHNRSKRTFDPDDARRIKRTRLGVWDLYEEIQPEIKHFPGSSKLEQYSETVQCLPYVWRMLKDVGTLKNCWLLLVVYLLIHLLSSLIPATVLWYSGKLLKIVESAVETRTVDKRLLIQVATGRILCAISKRLTTHFKSRVGVPLDQRIKAHYSAYVFKAYARLDVPTFDDPVVQRQLEAASGGRSSVAWDTVNVITQILSTAVQFISQVSVLISVLHGQRDGALIAVLSFASPLLDWFKFQKYWSRGVWAATCRNDDYKRMQGMKRVVVDPSHRKELIAGSLPEYLVSAFYSAQARVGDAAGDFMEMRRVHQLRDKLTSLSLLSEPFREIPQIVFTLRAVQYPASIPISLASLHLIQSTVSSFSHVIFTLFDQFGSVAEHLDSVRKLYEISNIPNKVVDGNKPFPEDQQQVSQGLSLEFRNVSFSYPGSEDHALQSTSFKIERGQLCIIVGANGSGKSTVLKLIARLYDPTEGEILIDGRDIRTMKLVDLRRATSVLFQDYTHFPLSIKENIGLGDPDNADDNDKIEEAAKLGGAYDFVDRLPDGINTYLDRPVRDYYSSLPEGTKTLFGRSIDYSGVRGMGNMSATNSVQLSGGQMQRLAVSRTFMRSLGSENGVGLLLFDEPSASLDPAAEHGEIYLFERLRALRGSKTMIFSSHRFGNLTRHADLILYMKDSLVVESGTHESLMKQQGGYAHIYTLQAQAFLS